MAKITGRVQVVVNGVTLLNKAGATAEGLGLSGQPNYELKSVSGDSGHHGYVETPVPARCNVTVTDRDDIMINDFAKIYENGTVIFQAAGATGKRYTMNNATCLRNLTLTAGEGEIPLIFEGNYWTESVA